jgi:hypothetical protein
MARKYDENTGKAEAIPSKPYKKDIRCPSSSYYGNLGEYSSQGYLARQDKMAASDHAKLMKGKVK